MRLRPFRVLTSRDTPTLRDASHKALRWMETDLTTHFQGSALQRLGIDLCHRLARARRPPVASDGHVQLPAPASFVEMSRGDLTGICRAIALAPPASLHSPPGTLSLFQSYFGALALSYAAESDVLVAAVILRASARMGLRHAWLDEAEMFLRDQQDSDGGFGCFAPESGLPDAEADPEEARLYLTVEILWAFAEREWLRRARRRRWL